MVFIQMRLKTSSPKVFIDIAVAGRNAGRLVFELFADELPITAENFRSLCTGETGYGYYLRPRWYKHSPIHRCVPGFMCQGGDFLRGDGFGSESIYGQFFRDEKFIYRHSKRGVLSMAGASLKHTNSCQFFVTFAACPWLDGKHVAFGHLIEGWDALTAVEKQGTESGIMRRPCEVFNCGELENGTFKESVLKIEPPANFMANSEYTGQSYEEPFDQLTLNDHAQERPSKIHVPHEHDVFSLPEKLYKRNKFL